MIYLDANATEPMRPAARQAVIDAMELPGNPASVHAAGRQARQLLEKSRGVVAARVGAAAAELVFCSGGTEANAACIASLAHGRRVLVGATEHPAVLAAVPRVAPDGAAMLPVLADGTLDLPALERALHGAAPALVCLMLANNETGVLHPVAEASAVCRRYGALLHVDAVQAFGRVAVDVGALGAASLALSAHKIGGPKGVGAIVLAPGTALRPLIEGGGQERGRRGGTPALPAIAGFAAAAEAASPGDALAAWRNRIEAAATAAGAVVVGDGAPRLPNTVCLALPGVRADTQLIALDLAGFAVSAGAACSSGRVTESHVLLAMGLGDLAGCAIRVSLPWNTNDADVAAFIAAYAAMARRLAP